MKKYCRVCLISLFCCLWFFLGCSRSSDEETTNNASEMQRVTEVKTAEAKTGRIVNTISTTGTVVARRETRIRPKVSGRIESILVDEGDKVDAEQVLVRLEQEDFLLAKHRAEAALGTANAALKQLLAGARGEDIQQAQAALSQAKVSLEEAKNEFERMERLYKENVASVQMYDAAKARYKIAQQGVTIASETLKKAKAGPTEEDIQVARARVREADVGLEMAEQQLKDSTILAPFSGIVAGKFMNEGEIVSSMSPAEVIWLVDIDMVKIECTIPENEMSRVHVGAEATIEADAYAGDQFPGNISTISPVVDPGSRTFKVTIEIPNSGHRLKPGMFARVKIITEIHENTVLIPLSAITLVGGKEVIFVTENDVASQREVTTGLKDEESVEIIDGIQVGEHVIFEGNYGLEDGTKIRKLDEE